MPVTISERREAYNLGRDRKRVDVFSWMTFGFGALSALGLGAGLHESNDSLKFGGSAGLVMTVLAIIYARMQYQRLNSNYGKLIEGKNFDERNVIWHDQENGHRKPGIS